MDRHNLREFRRANNLTQTQLGDYLGVQKAYISRIEHDGDKFSLSKYEKILDNPFGWDTSLIKMPTINTVKADSQGTIEAELRAQVERYENKIENLNREIGELKALLKLAQANKNI